jgi:hypothetical protein
MRQTTWCVVVKNSGTGKCKYRSQVIRDVNRARVLAERFNKNNTDQTWDADVACVEPYEHYYDIPQVAM